MAKISSKLKVLFSVGALLSFFLQVFVLPESGVAFEQNQKTTLTHDLVSEMSSAPALFEKNSTTSHHDHFPSSHHHCDHCPSGVCCADIGEALSMIGPNVQDEKYLDHSSFWFYELISSQLRPPAVLS